MLPHDHHGHDASLTANRAGMDAKEKRIHKKPVCWAGPHTTPGPAEKDSREQGIMGEKGL